MSYEVYGPYIVVVMFITFLALFAWVLHPKNTSRFEEAAKIPLSDEDRHQDVTTDSGRIEK